MSADINLRLSTLPKPRFIIFEVGLNLKHSPPTPSPVYTAVHMTARHSLVKTRFSRGVLGFTRAPLKASQTVQPLFLHC